VVLRLWGPPSISVTKWPVEIGQIIDLQLWPYLVIIGSVDSAAEYDTGQRRTYNIDKDHGPEFRMRASDGSKKSQATALNEENGVFTPFCLWSAC